MKSQKFSFLQNEDWLSVVIAFGLILLSVLGWIGKQGLPIVF
ncbi:MULTISPECIES: hypothetical protein [Anaerolinea]|uniref:Uncharacterized protein n=1 Tax=Anaerolinea thermophila (strain DSM 14523 / JCM 11388 / NBRC 100420 / UNI-1) TaxID=926569 RepID=E8MXQ6_ANATU|nr:MULTISPECIES: hypothetical protein [Anaerolinea]BAJ64137.1 hypothetical protein ANT_21110 [Anaerolinea thermophila UNI-1]